MIRVLLFILFMAILAGIFFLIRKMTTQSSDSFTCSRCEGKGYWLAARGREKCDWCNGTGRLPK